MKAQWDYMTFPIPLLEIESDPHFSFWAPWFKRDPCYLFPLFENPIY